MAKRTTNVINKMNIPENLDDHPFYGLKLDDEQKKYRDDIWSKDKELIFCNAKAGTGKTTIAVATAVMLCQYGLYDDIVYVMHSVGDAQGYLPGTISEKSSVWFEGLYQALIVAGQQPQLVVSNESMTNQKQGTSFVTAITDTYLRGSNIGAGKKTILILDEAQNFPISSLRKTLSRACPGTKAIIIGHTGQLDLNNIYESGFLRLMGYCKNKNDERIAIDNLTTNYRGFISKLADESWDCGNNSEF